MRMNNAWRLLFFGYLFVFLRFEIVIDVLAAPVGYYMMYSAARQFSKQQLPARQLEIFSFIGIFLAVPGVFVPLNEAAGAWQLYAELLFVWKVITVFYVFGVWRVMAEGTGFGRLRERMKFVYVLYMGVHFAMMLVSAFSLNVGGSSWMSLAVIVSILTVLMDIALFFSIASFGRAFKTEKSSQPM